MNRTYPGQHGVRYSVHSGCPSLSSALSCVQVQLPQRDGEYVPCPDKIRELMRHPAWRDCCRKINHAANYAATCVLPLAKHGGKDFHQPYGGYTA